MEQKAIFIEINNVSFTFHLFDNDIDDSMKRKLSKLGLPDISINWPEKKSDRFVQIAGDLYQQGVFQCEGVSLTSTTNESIYTASYDSLANTISVSLSGEFFCVNTMDDDIEALLKKNQGFVSGARFRDLKGKMIKKSKDQWGMTSPLDGRIVKNSYDGESQKVDFKIIVKDGIFMNGQMV